MNDSLSTLFKTKFLFLLSEITVLQESILLEIEGGPNKGEEPIWENTETRRLKRQLTVVNGRNGAVFVNTVDVLMFREFISSKDEKKRRKHDMKMIHQCQITYCP